MKKVKFLVITLIAILLLFAGNAFASGENDGYIVKIPETKGIRLMSAMPDDAEYYGNGIYVVKTYDEAKKLSPYAEYIEPNHIVYLYDTYDYSTLINNNYSLNAVNILPMWNYGFYGDDVLVGVLDSGCSSHELITDALVEGHNFFAETKEEETDVTDTYGTSGHGTFVSGLIAARYGNTSTIGMAHHAKIMPLKIFKNGTTTDAVLCEAIYYAVNHGCKIINMSFGSPDFSQTMKDAIDYAVSQGIIVVSAVGNDAQNAENPNYLSYPASLDNVIGVGAVDSNYNRAAFSHYNSSVFVTAPGKNLRGLKNDTSSIKTGSGTSFSTPIVSGIIADMISVNENITLDEIKDILIATSNREHGFAEGEIRNDNYGYGIIDAGEIAKHMLFLKSKIVGDTIAEGLDDTLPVEDKSFTFFAKMEDIDVIEPQEFGIYFFASDEEIDEDKVKTHGEVYKANGKLEDGSYSVRLVNGDGETDYFNKKNIGLISYLKINDELKFGLLKFIK